MVWNSSYMYTAPSGMSNVISFCSDRYLQGIKRKESYFSIHSYIWNPRLLFTWCNQSVLNIFISDHYVTNNSKVQISFFLVVSSDCASHEFMWKKLTWFHLTLISWNYVKLTWDTIACQIHLKGYNNCSYIMAVSPQCI